MVESAQPNRNASATTSPWRSSTLSGLLAHHARQRPDELAVRFIEPGGASLADSSTATLTFGELAQRAAAVAAGIAERAAPGDRALLLCPPGADYIAALFGCFYAGVIAVPAYPPMSTGVDERLARLVHDSRPSVLLCTTALADLCDAAVLRDLPDDERMATIAVDRLAPADGDGASVASGPGDLALLQYTSGSTGNPRGVMLTHANLLANIASISAHLGFTSVDPAVFWLPPYHDMGLVAGILAPVVLGGETTLMSPFSFLASPLLWLEAVSRHRGAFSAAPNFAYELCVRKVGAGTAASLDLSSWRIVVNGAEPVRHETMDRFAERFAKAGFRRACLLPCYGLAEATLLVSGTRPGERRGASPRPRGGRARRWGGRARERVVSVGVPPPGTTLRVVDPQTRRACKENDVGEVWVQGPGVARGYWNNQPDTDATFAATLSDDPDAGWFLRTGDLAALRGGELYVTGRRKDVIILRGQNHYPHDIEDAATRSDARLRPGCLAAFEVREHDGQRIVLVAEVAKDLGDGQGEEIWDNVRRAVVREAGLGLDELVLVQRGASLKTSSGKIRRRATREAYLCAALPALATLRASPAPEREGSLGPDLAEAPQAEREAVARRFVCAHTAALLGYASADAIDAQRAFEELGMDSLQAVELRGRLEHASGLALPATLVFDHPTPSALASYLQARLEGRHPKPIDGPSRARSEEPIAIVGIGCRYPGGVESAEDLWELVAACSDAISEFPDDRGWDLERLFDSDPERFGTSYVRHGGFIAGAGDFDAGFFGMGPREALATDPQQRLLLEVAWEALEHARIDPTSLRGSATGVFAGISDRDYALGLARGQAEGLEGHLVTGTAGSVVSGRVAYSLGLEGPAITVDTACSSSLVALHLACRALRDGECSMALAGGVTVLCTPGVFIGFSRQRGLAVDGRCRSFSADASGTGFAEGVGLVVLERLSDAQRLRHRVLGVVRASATNQDGASNGLTAPSGASQERVIRQALADAGLSPGEVDAVEAHGTATTLGDPIEARALLATYGQQRGDRPLYLGSVKSNIGHTQAAAGVAGVIKMLMAMRHGVLPGTLHVDAPTPHVDWRAGAVELLTRARAWPPAPRPRRAAVSSFGMSGTNAHVILQEPPPPSEDEQSQPASPAERPGAPLALPWLLSAKSEPALRRQAHRLLAHVGRHPELEPLDVARSLASGRARFAHRAAVVGGDRDTLLARLAAVAAGEPLPEAPRGRAPTGGGPAKLAFVFPGQGSQWTGMALELAESSAVFGQRLAACAQALSAYVDWSLDDVLRGAAGAPPLERTDVVQPALFAVMVSLATLWRSAGVRPSVVIGHSQGEIAAAHVAGALSLDDAARVVALRSQALAELAGAGGMVSIAVAGHELEQLLARWEGRLSVAAFNGPLATVIAGDPPALGELLAACDARGVRARTIPVDYASHSVHVESIRERLLQSLAPIRPRSGEVPFLSTAAGEPLDTARLDAHYWYRALREPVRFTQATRALVRDGCCTFIEVSPHPVLTTAVQETAEDESPGADIAAIGSLRRGEGGVQRFMISLAEAFVHGVDVAWPAVFPWRRGRRIDLPTYAFERERYWLAPPAAAGDVTAAGLIDPSHPLLGAALRSASGDEWLFTGRVSLQSHPWLADHAVAGVALLPAAALVELVLRAGAEVGAEEVEELTLQAPVALPHQGAVELQLGVGEPDDSGRREAVLHARQAQLADRPAEGWARCASGVLAAAERLPRHGQAPAEVEQSLGGPRWPPPGAQPVDVEDLYDRLAALGLEYGPAFARLGAAWRRGQEVFAEVALGEDESQRAGSFALHPTLLDGALQAIAAGQRSPDDPPAELRLPFSWSGVRLHAAGVRSWRVRVSRAGEHSVSLIAADENGAPVASVRSMTLRATSATQLTAALGAARGLQRDSLFGLSWTAVPVAPRPRAQALVLLGSGDQPLARSLAETGCSLRCHRDLAALGRALDAGTPPPELVLVDCAAGADGAPPDGAGAEGTAARSDEPAAGELARMHASARHALSLAQSWLANERLSGSRLALITRRAVAVRPGEDLPGLAQSPVWGLLRSAQAESPERFALLDSDDTQASSTALAGALATGEPQLALREGAVHVPRLQRATAVLDADGLQLDPLGTVLVTGATGTIGARVAHHLVTRHGARRLLLVSRRGEDADGAAALQAELQALGASVTIAACDVSDRRALAGLLESLPARFPLRAVVHAAGTTDDGVVASLTPERVAAVLRAKADSAWHLHTLTEQLDLQAFVLFSSAAGTLGSPGQGNYAAANAFLDALATRRRARGLAGTSLAWGLWREASELTADMGAADHARVARAGLSALSSEQGLELFDAAVGQGAAFALLARLDPGALRAQARVGLLPAVLRGLVRVPDHRSEQGASLARRLAATPETDRARVLRDLVRGQLAAVLGHASPDAVPERQAFKELGLDSLGAAELAARLSALSGLRLSTTLVFDHPTPLALAGHLLGVIDQARAQGAAPTPVAAAGEPLAIVGMSCRYPGGVRSPEDLWSLVASGADAISAFPADRGWDLDGLCRPDLERGASAHPREGGFVYDASEFDAAFFGISPKEALAMDPQQRLLLEASWEALEDAGIDPESLRGSQTGVFAGVMYHDYGLSSSDSARAELGGYAMTGSSGSVVSGRVSYTFGLEGPAVSVDTACSSSLVALHLACQSLRAGECSLALAGGVTVLSSPAVFVEFARQRGLAADGRCKSFADGADGAGFSEGVGLVLLERLSDARRNGHLVLATVRGSAVNQDGASNGLSAPNGPAQQRVIAAALANAQLSPDLIDAVEAHGTGTTLGDPIEAQALLASYGRDRDRPLWLGSVKSNIGHAQAAAGVAGVIKMVQALRHGALPKTLHAAEPSRRVDWSAGAVSLLTTQRPWRASGSPRRAGVSSFGISGTNAHLILEEAPPPEPAVQAGERHGDRPERARLIASAALPLVASAASERALRAQAERLLAHLRAHSQLQPADVGGSLARGRSALAHRAVVLGGERAGLLGGLGALARGEHCADVLSAVAPPSAGRLAMLFTGQGAQRAGMGRELYETFQTFSTALEELCAGLDAHLQRPLLDVLFAPAGSRDARLLDHTAYAQVALFALEVALFKLIASWGVRPDVMLGHSIGELAAAHVAGVFSLPDACALVAARARLMGALPTGGAMVALGASEQEVRSTLGGYEGRVALAAVNGPRSVVISGDEQPVGELSATWSARGRKVTRLRVSHAFHSPRMEEMLSELAQVAGAMSLAPPAIPIVSSVTGEPLPVQRACSADYWVAQVREPVRFLDGMRQLAAQGVRTCLELGPDGVLSVLAQSCLPGDGDAGARDEADRLGRLAVAVPVLRAGRPEARTLVAALAELWTHGVDVDWAGLFERLGAQRVALPTYAFQRRRYWLQARAASAADAGSLGQTATGHPLLGAGVALAQDGRQLFTGRLSLRGDPWLGDYSLLGSTVLPAAAFLELALHAGAQVGCGRVARLDLEAPLVLAEHGAVQLQLSVGARRGSGARSVDVYARREPPPVGVPGDAPWTRHASGVLETAPAEPLPELEPGPWPPPGAQPLDVEYLYDRLAESGFSYGPSFRCLRAAWRLGADVLAEVALPDERAGEGFTIHPALLDAAMQAMAAASPQGATGVADDGGRPLAPASFADARVGAGAAGALRVRLRAHEGSLGVVAADESGRSVLSIEELLTTAVDPARLRAAGARAQRTLARLRWVEPESSPPRAGQGAVAALGDVELDGLQAVRYRDVDALARALDGGEQIDTAVARADTEGEHRPGAHDGAHRALALVQSWLAERRVRGLRLVLITRGAVAVTAGRAPQLSGAGAWGLIRSAQSEHPGRFCLLDLEDGGGSPDALAGAIALGEPQLAIREGRLLVPRLTPASDPARGLALELDPGGTVLITGGERVAELARHLATRHGARHVLLASRGGGEPPGLGAELGRLGCELRAAACDLRDRRATAQLLASVPDAHPLTAVFHGADGRDERAIESLDRQRLERVLARDVDVALALDRLTAGLALSAFVLFGSPAGTLGGVGQAAAAAASALLEALAQRRRHEGLPAKALAWGPWPAPGEPAPGDHAPGAPRRDGLQQLEGEIRSHEDPVPPEAGHGPLLDASFAREDAVLYALSLDAAALRVAAQATPAPLRGLAGERREAARESPAALRPRLTAAPGPERDALLLELVRARAADVLGHASAADVEPERTLMEQGMDSLGAVQLAGQLTAATGVGLASSVAFDQPTPVALARHLGERIQRERAGAGASSRREAPGTLCALLESARERGTVADMIPLLIEAARFRAPPTGAVEPARCSTVRAGESRPLLICVPSFVAGSGPHQFVRIARALARERGVTALHLPGFAGERRAPTSWSAAIEALTAGARAAAGEAPFVLVGYSSGGFLAHAIAQRCEAQSGAPAGLITIDTYAPRATEASAAAIAAVLLDRSHEYLQLDDDDLIAMGAFLGLVREWRPGVVEAPALALYASQPLDGGRGRASRWRHGGSAVELPGDHFSVIEAQAGATATAIDGWLDGLLGQPVAPPRAARARARAQGVRRRVR
jgi:acyl transferase domain-containing protein/acyl-CoA synthetase (AMP-forming)/AMP-acid ligase II/acyl carrier protein